MLCACRQWCSKRQPSWVCPLCGQRLPAISLHGCYSEHERLAGLATSPLHTPFAPLLPSCLSSNPLCASHPSSSAAKPCGRCLSCACHCEWRYAARHKLLFAEPSLVHSVISCCTVRDNFDPSAALSTMPHSTAFPILLHCTGRSPYFFMKQMSFNRKHTWLSSHACPSSKVDQVL